MKNILFYSLLLCFSVAFSQSNTNEVSFPVYESPKGIYLLISDKTFDKQEGFSDIKIIRSINGGKPKELGKPSMAANMEEFEKIVGKESLLDIARIYKLETRERAFQYVQNHTNLIDYGILSLNFDLGVALGASYLDKDLTQTKAGDKITYNITFTGRESYTTSTTIVLGQKPQIEKPKLSKVEVTDSIVELKWKVSSKNSPDIFFADIYYKEGHPANFIKAATVFATNEEKEDSVAIKWTQTTKKGYTYQFYIVPKTQTNLLGSASDTISVISIRNQAIAQPSNMISKDSTNGIWLSWENPIEIKTQKAWLLQRTYSLDKPYINIATLDVNNNSYTDMEIEPGEMYYYRIKTIALNHDTIGPSVHSSTRHLSKAISPVAPNYVEAKALKEGVLISWGKVKMIDVIGYYVYRSNTENNRFDLISELLKDSTYIDKEELYGRNRYTYGVRAYTSSEMMGIMGISNLYVPANNVKPAAPTGAIYYNLKGLTHLTWDDAQHNDNSITEYRVYKKTGELPSTLDLNLPTRMGFKLIANVKTNEFDDIISNNEKAHYAITSIDQYGQESEVGQIVSLETMATAISTPLFSVRKTSKGVIIDWDLPNNSNKDITYTIYKRSATEKVPIKIVSINANKLSYTDVNVKAGNTYYYTIMATTNNQNSEISNEKYVRY